jgi:hypothetical protein
MASDNGFLALSVEEQLRALSRHLQSAIRFLESGVLAIRARSLDPAPDVSKLVGEKPGLGGVIDRRWREAQECQHVGCYTAAIILMGSILEALLLARATLSIETAQRSPAAPKQKDKEGKEKQLPLQRWTLQNLVDVAADVGWIKRDRHAFSHALRESRNIVHPWQEVDAAANFDSSTCRTSWEVLRASVEDLVRSCP